MIEVAVWAASCSLKKKSKSTAAVMKVIIFFTDIPDVCSTLWLQESENLNRFRLWRLFITRLSQMISVTNCTSVKLSGCCHKCEWIHCGRVVYVLNDTCKFLFSFMPYHDFYAACIYTPSRTWSCNWLFSKAVRFFTLIKMSSKSYTVWMRGRLISTPQRKVGKWQIPFSKNQLWTR